MLSSHSRCVLCCSRWCLSGRHPRRDLHREPCRLAQPPLPFARGTDFRLGTQDFAAAAPLAPSFPALQVNIPQVVGGQRPPAAEMHAGARGGTGTRPGRPCVLVARARAVLVLVKIVVEFVVIIVIKTLRARHHGRACLPPTAPRPSHVPHTRMRRTSSTN